MIIKAIIQEEYIILVLKYPSRSIKVAIKIFFFFKFLNIIILPVIGSLGDGRILDPAEGGLPNPSGWLST